ncbi:fibronectin type III domain containing protein 3C1-like [Arvicanthis niloticus]|uniref:fibronectin type III domain containing protein 3C1-like n=1 Tax=Arvicanthis niloticus TaxID=61156 RepID=UPI0014873CA8|nr:fibronectin type III domain containing protein 3C1-like [Arvicanthis niloticus]
MAENNPDTNPTDTITSSSGDDPSISLNAGFYTDINNNIIVPFISTYSQYTSDGTQEPPDTKSIPSYTSESACNTFISENARTTSSINDGFIPSDAVSISENNHRETEGNLGAGENKQVLGENQRKSQSANASLKEHNPEYRTHPYCFKTEKPVVSNIQTRSATVSWTLKSTEKYDINSPTSFELALSSSGKNGIYKNIYTGDGVTVVLHDLQPCMVYFLRVTTIRDAEHRSVSEVVSFTTPGCEPDPPLAPTLISRTKNSLNLQWKGSNDNGSKISSFVLEWDEGKGEDFKICYSGPLKQHKVFKLRPSTKYSFRLAAKNHFGCSNFSETAVFYTSGNTPPAPLPPKLKEAGVHSLSLEWCAPTNPNPNYTLSYVLEMEEENSGLGFKPKYNGEDLSCTIRSLQRNTTYKFRIFAYNLEGRSNPSGEVKYTTRPARPGCPNKPYVVGTILARKVTVGWDLPKDNGGMNISSYSLEVCENSDGANLWKIIYNGTLQEFLYDDLQPGTTYKLRVFCTSPAGQSRPSDVLTIQTPTLPLESCRSLPLRGKTKGKDANLPDNHSANGKSEALVRGKKAKGPHHDRKECPSSEKKCAAVNRAGVGLFGGTAKVTTPGTVPAMVSMVQEIENKVPAKLSPTCIAIRWEEPDCHGSPITGYNIEYGDKKIVTVKRVTEYVLENLQPNTTYRIRIQAINHYGLSPFSPTIRCKTKPLPPEPPQLNCVVYGHQSLRLKWGTISSKKSLANFINYNLLMEDRSGRFSVIYHGPDVTHKVQKLSEYTEYKFKIQACNEAGEGPESNVYTFTTTKSPPTALKAPKVHPLNNNGCEIKWESLAPMKGDHIVYCLQVNTGKKANQIYKGPNTSFSLSNYHANSRYRFKVCAGRQYETSNGLQELWGPYSPSALFSTYKHHSGHGKGSGGKGKGNHNEKRGKYKIKFALIALLCAVAFQYVLLI